MKLRLFSVAAALLSAGISAHASTITYTLTSVGLTYGVSTTADGTLNGTFSFNSATNTLTSANIVASPGIVAPYTGGGYDFTYGGSSPDSTAYTGFSTFFTLTSIAHPNDVLELSFNSALNGSGPDVIASGTYENEASLGVRNVGTGFSAALGSAAAPEPSSIALLGTGLFSLGGLLRRRRA
jgi:hypothetical protein